MKLFIAFLKLVFQITKTLFLALYHLLVTLMDIIDGGEEDEESFNQERTVWYNHLTGEIDPLKRPDGLYDRRL